MVAGLVGEAVTTDGAGGDVSSSGAPSDSVDTDDLPEMPEFLREFLEGALEEPEIAEESTAAPAGASSRQSGERSVRSLKTRGLPVGAVAVRVGEMVYRVTLVDALGFINLNRAGFDELASLFEMAGAEPYAASGLAAELVDYRDEDGLSARRAVRSRRTTHAGGW